MDIFYFFFLFLHQNIYCGYTLEVPQQGTSNVYSQHMFWCKNKKKISTWMPLLSTVIDYIAPDNRVIQVDNHYKNTPIQVY